VEAPVEDTKPPAPAAATAAALAPAPEAALPRKRVYARRGAPTSGGAIARAVAAAAAQRGARSPLTPADAYELLLRLRYVAPHYVSEHETKGRCIHSGGVVPKGALFCEYGGQLVSGDEAQVREATYQVESGEAAADPDPDAEAADEAGAGAWAGAEAEGGRGRGGGGGGDGGGGGGGGGADSIGSYSYFFKRPDSHESHCVDATAERREYGVGRLLSHSRRRPNLSCRAVLVDGVPRLMLVAREDVRFGDEVKFDYGERSKAVLRRFNWLQS
jgi:hypothetical protein